MARRRDRPGKQLVGVWPDVLLATAGHWGRKRKMLRWISMRARPCIMQRYLRFAGAAGSLLPHRGTDAFLPRQFVSRSQRAPYPAFLLPYSDYKGSLGDALNGTRCTCVMRHCTLPPLLKLRATCMLTVRSLCSVRSGLDGGTQYLTQKRCPLLLYHPSHYRKRGACSIRVTPSCYQDFITG